MKERFLTPSQAEAFAAHLKDEERSKNTSEKYLRDILAFMRFVGHEIVEKETVIAYKQLLTVRYKPRSVNSMLAAVNSLFDFLGWYDLKVKAVKLQQQIYCPEEKELSRSEYYRLCRAAEEKHDTRLSLILQTVCGTGIRIGELAFITVEAVRAGEATVSLKGKTRTVLIVRDLQKKLLRYAAERHISQGAVFVTRSGKPVNRTNIWRDMKALCDAAGVKPSKVFPHNLRHLFARIFYAIEKDIAKLADILGHSNINTTRIYIISTGTEHRRRMEAMHLIL